MDNECIISTCSSFSNHKMYYFIHFELTLKQMGKKLKVSLKQFHGYLYAVIILQFCKQSVPDTPYCQPRLEQVRTLVPMC